MFAKRLWTLSVVLFLLVTLAPSALAQVKGSILAPTNPSEFTSMYYRSIPPQTKRREYTIHWPSSPIRASITSPAPVVVYLHGFSADGGSLEPVVDLTSGPARDLGEFMLNEIGRLEDYDYLVRHWSQQGWIVITPRWQVGYDFFTPATWLGNAESIIRRALNECGAAADRQRVAIGGHSMGAVLALRLAADQPAGLPTFRAVALHDISGFDFTPLMSLSFRDKVPYLPIDAYDDFSGMRSNTQLLLLTALDTLVDAFNHPHDKGGFAQHITGGMIARVWHRTPAAINKQHLVVLDNTDLGIQSTHDGVKEPGIREVYREHTTDLFQAAFKGRTYTPNVSARYYAGHPKTFSFGWWNPPWPTTFYWSDKIEFNRIAMDVAALLLDGVYEQSRTDDWYHARWAVDEYQYCLGRLAYWHGDLLPPNIGWWFGY